MRFRASTIKVPSRAILSPRLGQLLALAEKLGEAQASGAIDALTRLGTSALVFDLFCRSLRANDHAERLFDQDFHLSQRRPLLVEALPVRTGFADALFNAAALVAITDLANRPAPSENQLGAMFALTLAEARFVAALASGGTIVQAAEALQIARETARTQLKAVFAKTQTSRQAELMALLAGREVRVLVVLVYGCRSGGRSHNIIRRVECFLLCDGRLCSCKIRGNHV